MTMIAAGLVILLACFVAGTTSEQTEAPGSVPTTTFRLTDTSGHSQPRSSTCPPPDPMCDCTPTKDDNGCTVCMCHERIPPAQCPQVKCPIRTDNKECSVEMRDGCRVCNCTPVNASTRKSQAKPSYAATHV